MKEILRNIGARSKVAFAQQINTNKKNKVLSDYLKLIQKNKNLIIKENKKDIHQAIKIKLKDNLINRLFLNESADLLFHYLILLQAKGFRLSDVEKVLLTRKR